MNNGLKVVLIGDGAVGKTCLITTFSQKIFPYDYIPTVFDTTTEKCFFEGECHLISLWDTGGGEDYSRLRPLSYPNTKVFLLCYSVDRKPSFENIESYWMPELKHFAPNVPVILVANKVDLRNKDNTKPIITTDEGIKLSKRIQAHYFIETSSLDGINVEEVFEHVVEICKYNPTTEKINKSHKHCCIC